eukprot:CAMPEP_0113444388 /NCGR_PEP_ID=MMETSP0014_2-20120614/2640_1 /TAXON_ID=2857 /ORGANISM="Nitzschia sp." /LENGTH=848 /DNA_ID=CAMNT_0000335397 /DNA_START=18 /DNA_END=2564 /DNA_ORIENTATION=- /assembly_acc=CAM_ASM_000159
MVRAFLKGGVWKNSEDEILKAAVQKYGKQQWARVASLLNRKSAKQCKARWHEWLDPSVRKVEWSREEEEKLLHLAKLMPAQWKTIGPLVGRTATQCQEHYEKLLDEAAAGTAGDGQQDGDAGDLRSQPLRVGQIDSHPETKPARPDPIDMDEDEIEMLQEARARLANTQGKKAKRKAREKMLAQAKRLSELQKRRELKQAGLLSSQAKKKARKSKDIDLGVEIPFHKPAPAGFHDVTSEVARSDSIREKQKKSVNFKQLNEQQYRSRDAEAAKAKKREEARMRALEKSNMQYVVAEVSKKNDPLNIRKRGPLDLPAPAVSDKELQVLAKMESAASAPNPAATASAMRGGVTSTLLADYSDRPLPTPMRTPMSGEASVTTGSYSQSESKQQSILREAGNLRMLERGQTPLLGGDDPMLDEAPEYGGPDGDDESKPPARPTTPGGPLASTRDHYGLNRPQSELRSVVAGGDDLASVGASTFATTTTMSIRQLAKEERRAAKRARKELEVALAALPAPQFEYELEAPMDIDDDEATTKVETVMEEDMADLDAAERRRLREEADKLYEARSSVVKRVDLLRPAGAIPLNLPTPWETEVGGDGLQDAEALVDKERITLLKHDAFAFPVEASSSMPDSSTKKSKKRKNKEKTNKDSLPPETPLDHLPEEALDAAKDLIQKEREALIENNANALMASGVASSLSQARDLVLSEILENKKSDESIYMPDGSRKSTADKKAMVESLTLEFDTLQESTSFLRKKNEKTESKIALLTGGLAKRAEKTTSEVLQLYHGLKNAEIEESVYKTLQNHEERGAVARIDKLRSDIARLQNDESRLHGIYQELLAAQSDAVAESN